MLVVMKNLNLIAQKFFFFFHYAYEYKDAIEKGMLAVISMMHF